MYYYISQKPQQPDTVKTELDEVALQTLKMMLVREKHLFPKQVKVNKNLVKELRKKVPELQLTSVKLSEESVPVGEVVYGIDVYFFLFIRLFQAGI